MHKCCKNEEIQGNVKKCPVVNASKFKWLKNNKVCTFVGWWSISWPLRYLCRFGGYLHSGGGTCPNFSNTTEFTLQTPNSEFNTWTLLPTACHQVNQGEVWSCAHGAEKESSQQAAPGGCVQALQWRVQPEYSGKIQKRRWDWWNCFKGPRITHNS